MPVLLFPPAREFDTLPNEAAIPVPSLDWATQFATVADPALMPVSLLPLPM